jgi:hypothetical protein
MLMTAGSASDRQDAHRSGSFFGRHRRIATAVTGAILAVGFAYFVVPRIVGLGPTLRRLLGGRIGWLVLGVGVKACSMLGDIVMFRRALAARGTQIGWRRTADIRMGGAAATKLLAVAGTGGIALTVWTLRGWGLSAADVVGGLTCYMLFTYAVYLVARGIRPVAWAIPGSGADRPDADSREHRHRGDPARAVDAVSRRAGRTTARAAGGTLDRTGSRQVASSRDVAADDPFGVARRD